jgi:hypothetical protein
MGELVSIHTIPVPAGWSPEQAWEHLSRGNRFEDAPRNDDDFDARGWRWASLEIDGALINADRIIDGRLVRVLGGPA